MANSSIHLHFNNGQLLTGQGLDIRAVAEGAFKGIIFDLK